PGALSTDLRDARAPPSHVVRARARAAAGAGRRGEARVPLPRPRSRRSAQRVRDTARRRGRDDGAPRARHGERRHAARPPRRRADEVAGAARRRARDRARAARDRRRVDRQHPPRFRRRRRRRVRAVPRQHAHRAPGAGRHRHRRARARGSRNDAAVQASAPLPRHAVRAPVRGARLEVHVGRAAPALFRQASSGVRRRVDARRRRVVAAGVAARRRVPARRIDRAADAGGARHLRHRRRDHDRRVVAADGAAGGARRAPARRARALRGVRRMLMRALAAAGVAMSLLLAACATPSQQHERNAGPVAPDSVLVSAPLSPDLEARILAIDPRHVSDDDVRHVLAQGPTPRIVALHGGIYPVHLVMESFADFLIGMGYPEREIRDPGSHDLTHSPYEDARVLAGEIVWYYEHEGVRPMMVGHSQGGMQAVKVLYDLAGLLGDSVTVVDPVTHTDLGRMTFLDPLTGKTRPVTSFRVPYASSVGAGGLASLLPNQWIMAERTFEIPDTVEDFTGFQIGVDLIALDNPRTR